MKPITLKIKLSGGEGSVIPKGVVEDLLIRVRDEIATYHFKDAKITKAFADRQNKDGIKSQYIERIQTTVCSYPGMNQKELTDHISRRLKTLAKENNGNIEK
jgi:hypothetical protein